MTEELRGLAALAIEARESAYAPYSSFRVGAALLCGDGSVYTGCNIENAAYTPSVCAERTAFFKAVSEGKRAFTAIAVAGWRDGHEQAFAYPCGVCRQVMMEFTDPAAFMVVVAAAPDKMAALTLEQLLPHGFGPANLNG